MIPFPHLRKTSTSYIIGLFKTCVRRLVGLFFGQSSTAGFRTGLNHGKKIKGAFSMLESLKKNKIGILLMLVSSLFVCVGQLLWKLSGGGLTLQLIIGFVSYGIGALLMMVAYRFGRLSVLHPMLSMSYVFSTILGIVVLSEPVGKRIVAIILILIGVILIGGGDEE